MKLFFKPGACSLAPHIVLHEIGGDFSLEAVDTDTKLTDSGADYLTLNPKGYVPTLALDSGELLTEGASVLQYLADQHPQLHLAPPVGTIARARLQEYLNYIASELHKAFGPLFSSSASDGAKAQAVANVSAKFDYLNTLLSDDRKYLLGNDYSVADAHLFAVTNWANFVGIDLADWPKLQAVFDRIAQRPATQAAMQAEGLV